MLDGGSGITVLACPSTIDCACSNIDAASEPIDVVCVDAKSLDTDVSVSYTHLTLPTKA